VRHTITTRFVLVTATLLVAGTVVFALIQS
jgi:hypothetical protein